MESLQKMLLVVPMMVLASTAYVACSSDEGDFTYPLDAAGDSKKELNIAPDGSTISWPDVVEVEDALDNNIDDADSDIDDADAPFSGTG